MQAPSQQLDQLSALLREVWDVVEGRVTEPEPPEWCSTRGWEGFLLGLSDEDLERAEHEGLAALAAELGAPESLQDLAQGIADATAAVAAGRWEGPLGAQDGPRARDGASARKRGQVEALARLVRDEAADYTRVVDVGAGLGHLTRELSGTLEAPALGLERDAERVSAARALTVELGVPEAQFETFDAVQGPLAFSPGDLAVGLHACGSLGDALVGAAARDGVDLLLVNCCLQHVDGGAREPLSQRGRDAGLVLRRDLIGLTNLGSRRRVGGTTAGVMRTRTTRHGMRLLLRARGVDAPYGSEMRGVQLRKARRGLATLAEVVLAKRGLEPASPDEIAACEERAEAEYARIRRLSLPRGMLGRLLELAIVLDRACALEEAGHRVKVGAVFPFDLSPRNLGIVARAGRREVEA